MVGVKQNLRQLQKRRRANKQNVFSFVADAFAFARELLFTSGNADLSIVVDANEVERTQEFEVHLKGVPEEADVLRVQLEINNEVVLKRDCCKTVRCKGYKESTKRLKNSMSRCLRITLKKCIFAKMS